MEVIQKIGEIVADFFTNPTTYISGAMIVLGFLLYKKDNRLDLIDGAMILVGVIGFGLWLLEIVGLRGVFSIGFVAESDGLLAEYFALFIKMIVSFFFLWAPFKIVKVARGMKKALGIMTLAAGLSIVAFTILPPIGKFLFAGRVGVFVIFVFYIAILFIVTNPSPNAE